MVARTKSGRDRVPDAQAIGAFRDRPGVWLTFAGSAFLILYAERLQPLGLKPNWVTALAIIAEQPGITQSGLARALRINRASSMALATTLESVGYISRAALAGRNQVALTVTSPGQRKLAEACAIEDDLVAATLDWLSPDEMATFVGILKRLTGIVRQLPAA